MADQLDKAALLAFLKERATRFGKHNIIAASIYDGLADRVKRGEFDYGDGDSI